jgi:hypothetical protein
MNLELGKAAAAAPRQASSEKKVRLFRFLQLIYSGVTLGVVVMPTDSVFFVDIVMSQLARLLTFNQTDT